VTTRAELDALSSRELHDKAVHHAETHADIKFLWEVLRALPAAEAAEGHLGRADTDIASVSGFIADALTSGRTDVSDALRPLYIDYLLKH
jgi:hypothetical protein